MVINPKDMKVEEVAHMRDGDGSVVKMTVAPAAPDMHLRLLGRFTIRKGCSIGMHEHKGEVEYYYILSGQGIVTENDGEKTVNPGDVVITGWDRATASETKRTRTWSFWR